MTLIKCFNCGKEISDKSKICIHCRKKLKKHEFKKTKMFLKISLLIIGVLITCITLYVVLNILFPIKDVDITKKYESYLNYALGNNWFVENKETYRNYENFWLRESYRWEITYKNKNNESSTILFFSSRFDNTCINNEICNDYYFINDIVDHYMQELNSNLRKEISDYDVYASLEIVNLYTYERNCEIIKIPNGKYEVTGIKCDEWINKKIRSLIDDKKGLKLTDISIEQLDKDYYYALVTIGGIGTQIMPFDIEVKKYIIDEYNLKNTYIAFKNFEHEAAKTEFMIDGKITECIENCETKDYEELIINKEDYIMLDNGW